MLFCAVSSCLLNPESMHPDTTPRKEFWNDFPKRKGFSTSNEFNRKEETCLVISCFLFRPLGIHFHTTATIQQANLQAQTYVSRRPPKQPLALTQNCIQHLNFPGKTASPIFSKALCSSVACYHSVARLQPCLSHLLHHC